MRSSPEIPFNAGEYLRDTMGLSRAEHGSYLLLIMAYWTNGGPLPSNDERLRKIALCPPKEWEQTRATLEPFFVTGNGFWKHKRLDRDLAADRAKREAIQNASALGVQARREMGQLPPVQPSVLSPVERVSRDNELKRVERRIEHLKNCHRDEKIVAELKAMRERRKELLRMLDYRA